jgi:hypothetical protein
MEIAPYQRNPIRHPSFVIRHSRAARPMIPAVDLSWAQLTAASCACLRAQGYGRIVNGLRYVSQANQAVADVSLENLRIAHAEGFELEAYAYLWLGGPIEDRIARSLEACAPYPVRRLWLDFEDNGHGASGIPRELDVHQVIDCVHRAIAASSQPGASPWGLYSARWWWAPATGDSPSWRDEPWWIAQYDGIADPTVFTPFAGITQPAMKQYQGTTQLCGLSVDLNAAAETRVPVHDELADLVNLLGYLQGDVAGAIRRPVASVYAMVRDTNVVNAEVRIDVLARLEAALAAVSTLESAGK